VDPIEFLGFTDNFFADTPLEQLPMLVIGDKKLNQSISVCRYLAKEIGLDGKTSYENFEIDSVADSITDFRMSKLSFRFIA